MTSEKRIHHHLLSQSASLLSYVALEGYLEPLMLLYTLFDHG